MPIILSTSNQSLIQKKLHVQLLFFAFHYMLDIVAIVFTLLYIPSDKSSECEDLPFLTIVDSLLMGGIMFFVVHSMMIFALLLHIFFASFSWRLIQRCIGCLVCTTGVILLSLALHCIVTVIWIPVHLNAMQNSNMICFHDMKPSIVRLWMFSYIYLFWISFTLCIFCIFSDYFNISGTNVRNSTNNSRYSTYSTTSRGEIENIATTPSETKEKFSIISVLQDVL